MDGCDHGVAATQAAARTAAVVDFHIIVPVNLRIRVLPLVMDYGVLLFVIIGSVSPKRPDAATRRSIYRKRELEHIKYIH